jgi:uncharacterized protein (DUF1810 family)
MSGPSSGNDRDPFDLERFVRAQATNYQEALAEIRGGEKVSHWMWYVYPQLAGLGFSSTARFYGLKGAAEARAYLAHPILGPRLRECCEAALAVEEKTAHDIFGSPDDLKLRSCATLFAAVAPDESLFRRLLEKYYAGRGDDKTLRLLET